MTAHKDDGGKLRITFPFLAQEIHEILHRHKLLLTDPAQRSNLLELADSLVNRIDYEAVREAALNGGEDAHSQAIAAELQVARELHSKGITRGIVDRQYRRVA